MENTKLKNLQQQYFKSVKLWILNEYETYQQMQFIKESFRLAIQNNRFVFNEARINMRVLQLLNHSLSKCEIEPTKEVYAELMTLTVEFILTQLKESNDYVNKEIDNILDKKGVVA